MQQPSQMQRTRSQELVPDSNHDILDEDPLLISQSLTYVTDDGSVLHSFNSAPFSSGTLFFLKIFMPVVKNLLKEFLTVIIFFLFFPPQQKRIQNPTHYF